VGGSSGRFRSLHISAGDDRVDPPRLSDSPARRLNLASAYAKLGHPCVGGLFLCDPFEPDNVLAVVNQPKSAYLDFSGATTPQDIFHRVWTYTQGNYFSHRTVFNINGGPAVIDQDSSYFYASCLAASRDFGTCVTVHGQPARKIAYKGIAYNATGQLLLQLAEIDSVIAHEQFAELGPVAIQAVVSLIKLYAPMLTVDVSNGGTVNSNGGGISCANGPCSALMVQGSQATLTVTPSAGFVFAGWSGDCSGLAR